VPRSERRYTDYGNIPELMGRIAAHGTKIMTRGIDQRLRKLEAEASGLRLIQIVWSVPLAIVSAT